MVFYKKPFGFQMQWSTHTETSLPNVSSVDSQQAVRAGVKPGWRLITVNGQALAGMPPGKVINILKQAPPPVHVSFLRPS